ncbi:MAG TPA: DUF4139 domain-containing protein [Planctomycetaceae bacterium]|nr:DUF4139 domain-containing protein [Planctomycetaceae bacterium]
MRADHVADVLASLNVYGPVAVVDPPSYRPIQQSELNLSINAERALEDLAIRLSGTKVVADKAGGSVEGTLVGLHIEPEGKIGERIFPKSLVILSDHGFTKVALKELQKLRVEDEAVRGEIAKALDRSRQQIRPRSTVIDLAVRTDQDAAEVTVQYTVPAAAWKISYRLRVAEGCVEFQGFAVVDNNTDEAWKDCLISVVTGEPITFSTDLADSKIPLRGHVDVVRQAAVSAVEVEDSFLMAVPADSRGVLMAGAAAEGPGETEVSLRRAKLRKQPAAMLKVAGATVAAPEAEVREVGDFCVFESQVPVSIDANRSAAIPVFNTALKAATTVLYYKSENHPERPYRAIQFKNETPHSLGRGVCTVYEEGTYAGSCIIPATRPGGESLLPHALETGVRIRREKKRQRSKLVGLRLSEGFCYTNTHQTQDVLYRIRNLKDQAFTLLVDHEFSLPEPQVKCSVAKDGDPPLPLDIKESLKNGVRLSVDLAPQAELVLRASESRVQQSTVELADVKPQHEHLKARWLEENLVHTNGPLADDPGIRECLEIQQALDLKGQEISDAVSETERLAARQERLRKNIGTGGHDDQTAQWKVELGEAESRINTLEEETIPKLRQDERTIRDQLRGALLSLSAEWRVGEP